MNYLRRLSLINFKQTSCSLTLYRRQHTVKAKTTRDFPPVAPVFAQASKYGEKIALKDQYGEYTYRGLFLSSRQLASDISAATNQKIEERIAILCSSDASYLISQWACWMSGQTVVPLSPFHPQPVLEHYITNSEASLVIATKEHAPALEKITKTANCKIFLLEDSYRLLALRPNPKIYYHVEEEAHIYDPDSGLEPEFYNNSKAIIVYTSGTTGSPRGTGVVFSHANIQAQVSSLLQTWEWNSNDTLLHTLPLHHTVGIIMLACPFVVGAKCVMLPNFDASVVWSELLAINRPVKERVNMFVAVPSMYVKLAEEYERAFAKNTRMEEYVKAMCSRKIKLMVNGSAPLSDLAFEKWKNITGHQVVEQYGMTETGVVMSGIPKSSQQSGYVGSPLPNVRVQIVDTSSDSASQEVLVTGDHQKSVINSTKSDSGELLIKSPGMFIEYWKKPKLTRESFTKDGWFKTGDIAKYEDKTYRILGRKDIDVIQTGGYKVSALEIENQLLNHPDIKQCVVIGLPDSTWGQKVVAVVVTKAEKELSLSKLREWSKDKLPPYAVPTELKTVKNLPINTMGKVNKKDLLHNLFPNVNY